MPLPTLSFLDLTEYHIPNTVFSLFGYDEGIDFTIKERKWSGKIKEETHSKLGLNKDISSHVLKPLIVWIAAAETIT